MISKNAVVANALAWNAKYVKGAKVVSPKGTVRGEIVGVRAIYQHGLKDEVFDVLLESGPRKGEVMRSQREGEWLLVNSVRNANSSALEKLIADGDNRKWDSLAWMPKVIGPGSLFPDAMRIVGGLGYDQEAKIREAWKSGKYNSVIFYKNGTKKGEIAVNACVARSTNAVVAKAMARNSVFITRDSRRDNWWVRGTVNGLKFLAKVYDEPSGFGIDHGRVSKLEIRDKDGNIAVTYDRGWDKRPKTAEMKKAYTELVKAMEKLAKAYHPGELLPSRSWNSRRDLGNATNADVPVGTVITIIDTPFRYGGERGQIVGRLGHKYKVKLIDRQDKPVVELQPNQVGAKNAALNAMGHDFDIAGVYGAAKKMVQAGAKHIRNYLWEIPESMVHGADVIVRRAGGKLEVVGDASRPGFVTAKVTDPLAQALERKGVMNAMARNAKFKVGGRVKVYHGTKEGKIIRVREGMRGPIYEVQLGTIYGAPKVSEFSEKEMVAANSRACNAKFKVGDKVQVAGIGTAVIKTVDEIKSVVGPRIKYGIDIGGGRIMTVPEKDVVKNTECVARNAAARNAWTADEKRDLGGVKFGNEGRSRIGRDTAEFSRPMLGSYFVKRNDDGGMTVYFNPTNPYEKGWMKKASTIAEVKKMMGAWN